MKIRILPAAAVRQALTMPLALQAMRAAFSQFSAGAAVCPPRSRVPTARGATLVMPAWIKHTNDFAVKVVSIFPPNAGRGLPVVNAAALVLDPGTGQPLALLDGAELTAIRTGAAGALAASVLARPDAEVAGVFGAGVQARAQIRGLLAVRPIRRLILKSRSQASAARLAEEIASWPSPPQVILGSDAASAVRGADIIVTATTSPLPLFDGQDLRPGAHVNAVGAFTPETRELDDTVIQRARVFVDSRQACLAEAGDIVIPRAPIEAELGEVLNGARPGRLNDEEITVFKSVGIAVQDAAAAAAALRHAEAQGLGQLVDF